MNTHKQVPAFKLSGVALLSLVLASSNVWAAFVTRGATGGDATTANSEALVTGRPADNSVNKVAIYVEKLGSGYGVGMNYYDYPGGEFTNTAFLSFGPGTYQIKVWGCKTSTVDNSIHCTAPTSDFTQIVNADKADHMWLAPSGNIESDAKILIDQAETIVAGAKSDRERSQAIHDWVATNIGYDLKAVKANTDINTPLDALSVYRERLAVCEGISYLTAALHRAIGIRAKVIDGTGDNTGAVPTASGPDNHAWNEIFLDGRWVTVDVTWDSGYENQKGVFENHLSQEYFDPTPELFAKSHFKKNEKAE